MSKTKCSLSSLTYTYSKHVSLNYALYFLFEKFKLGTGTQ